MRIKLGIPLPLSNIAEAIKGKKQCYEDPIIEYLSTDSREIFKGDLFLPIKGVNFDGENFVDEAIKKGRLQYPNAILKRISLQIRTRLYCLILHPFTLKSFLIYYIR